MPLQVTSSGQDVALKVPFAASSSWVGRLLPACHVPITSSAVNEKLESVQPASSAVPTKKLTAPAVRINRGSR